MAGVLRPGSHRATDVADDGAVVAAMLCVEVAWAKALVATGVATEAEAAKVAEAAAGLDVDLDALAVAAEAAGNPVVPLVGLLREAAGDAAGAVHRGLTSQDVLDSALVLLARDAVVRLRSHLVATGDALASLARTHRDDVAVARTLTQWAVPTTFGLRAAQWLAGVDDAVARLDALSFPVQYGGAAGTRALLAELAGPGADAAAPALAAALGLADALPWHTRRGAVTAIADALVAATDALGVLAADVLLLGRPEVAEVRESLAEGRGGSSTMPHKQNPVLSVLVNAAAQQAPGLAAQLHLAAAGAVDERPDGAWHAEWPAFARLLELAVTAGSQAAELVAGLQVDTSAMAARVAVATDAGALDARGATGEAGRLVDLAVARWEGRHA
ncbi:3-carboxy-cis,cis-muconate cycloisomerase [Nocardioides aromaticivorans]|uniref:3-carboxy-cis,cis-muconate cycloisomerase n=1 Tax=Nocardioides aromaticivorans TaxID=200618 RepID=A0A7Z0CMC3_9ACTN|nr:lyase family protein [Nocardioides aromaticivorans]NYI46651.1 3-carboxy-cis,cis-muconate cycloisomerase [Nocardioides aromaticivorans]